MIDTGVQFGTTNDYVVADLLMFQSVSLNVSKEDQFVIHVEVDVIVVTRKV
jgi:hypothetical protein